MSIHTVTEEITINSQVEILAPPGERKETVIKHARKEVDRVRKSVGLNTMPTAIQIGQPKYQDGRKWLVDITVVHRTATVVDLED